MALDELRKQGVILPNFEDVKPLSEEEQLTIARLAAQGRTGDACACYIEMSLPWLAGFELSEVPMKPEYRELCDEAAYFTFCNYVPDYVDSKDNRDALKAYTAGRPLNVHLLEFAWNAVKAGAAQRASQPEPEPVNLDNLSNEEVDEAIAAATRLRAQQLRQR